MRHWGWKIQKTRENNNLGKWIFVWKLTSLMSVGRVQFFLITKLNKYFWFSNAYGILRDISPGCSLEGMMLKLKLQYIGHLMQRVDSLEKTLMLGEIGSRRRRGRQRMRWLDGNPDSMDMSLSELGSWWWTGRPGVVLWFLWSQKVGHNWATELNWPSEFVRLNFMCTKNIFQFQWIIKLVSTNNLGVFVPILWINFTRRPSPCHYPPTRPALFRENVCFCVICFPSFLCWLICFWNLCLVFHIQVNAQGISLF